MRIASVVGNITAAAGGGSGPPPQYLWPGAIDSYSVLFGWWTSSTRMLADYPYLTYNIYKNGTTLANQIASGVQPYPGLNGTLQFFYVDGGPPSGSPPPLVPGTTSTYYVTEVYKGTESAFSAPITMTTLQGATTGTGATPTNPPAAVIGDPTTWPVPVNQAPVAPTGGTTWTCTNLSSSSVAGTGTKGQTGCSLTYAVNNYSPGDKFILTAGATYQLAPQAGITWPALSNPSSKWTFVMSSNAPEAGGTGLVPWAYSPTVSYSSFLVSWTSSSAGTFSTAWAAKTGYYPLRAYIAATGASERAHVLCTQGSTAFTLQATDNTAMPLQSYVNTSTYSTLVDICILPGVTPCANDRANMATIQMADIANANGITASGTTSSSINYLRFIGVNIVPYPALGQTLEAQYCFYMPGMDTNLPPSIQPAESVYFDRCLFGSPGSENFPTNTNYTFCRHGISVNCNHFLLHQSYIYGICDNGGAGANGHRGPGTDANGILGYGGGPSCNSNSLLEAGAEGSIWGGVTIPLNNIPHDHVTLGSFYQKNPYWLWGGNGLNTNGMAPKNLFEYKCMVRSELRGSIMDIHWNSLEGDQRGRSVVPDARDQNSGGIGGGSITGSVSNGQLTVTAITGTIRATDPTGGGTWLNNTNTTNANSLPPYTSIVSQISGTTNGVGVYQLNDFVPSSLTIAAGTVFPFVTHRGIRGTCPWNTMTDFYLHDTLFFDCGSPSTFFTNDYCATTCTARIKYENLLIFCNPPVSTVDPTTSPPNGISSSGNVPDVIIDHVTLIYNTSAPGYTGANGGVAQTYMNGMYILTYPFSVTAGYGIPYYQSGKQDRWTVTYTLFDDNSTNGGMISGQGLGSGTLAVVNTVFTNYTFGPIINTKDPASNYSGIAPGPMYQSALSAVGMNNWKWGSGEALAAPASSPTDWVIGSGTYAGIGFQGISSGGGPSRPSYNTGIGLYVLNGYLYDSRNVEFRIRGVNQCHYDCAADATGIPNTNANCVRYTFYTTGLSVPLSTYASGISGYISKSLNVVATAFYLPGSSTVQTSGDQNASTLSSVATMWANAFSTFHPYEKHLIINIANEWGPPTGPESPGSAQWSSDYQSAIATIRAAGYTCPLMVDAGGFGQNFNDLFTYAQAVFNSDPQKNVIFSLHVYGNASTYLSANWASQLRTLANSAGMVFVIGEFGPGLNFGPSPTTVTPQQIISSAEASNLGWMAWAMDDGNDTGNTDPTFSMTVTKGVYTGSASQLTNWGQEMVDSTYGLVNAVKATDFP